MMDAEAKEKWCAALRSGKYLQGTGAMRYENKDGTVEYCCLGVLRDVVAPGTEYEDEATSLLQSNHDAGLNPLHARDLANMNDGTCGNNPRSFLEIADWLEAHPEV